MRHQSWALVCAIAGVPNVAVRTTAAAPSAMKDFVNIVVSCLLRALSIDARSHSVRAAATGKSAGCTGACSLPRRVDVVKKPADSGIRPTAPPRDSDASVLGLKYPWGGGKTVGG